MEKGFVLGGDPVVDLFSEFDLCFESPVFQGMLHRSTRTYDNQKGQCLGCTPDAAEFFIRGPLMFAGSPKPHAVKRCHAALSLCVVLYQSKAFSYQSRDSND